MIDGSHADRSCWQSPLKRVGPTRVGVRIYTWALTATTTIIITTTGYQHTRPDRDREHRLDQEGERDGGRKGGRGYRGKARGLGPRTWPTVNCQHLMSVLWRAARTATVRVVMAAALSWRLHVHIVRTPDWWNKNGRWGYYRLLLQRITLSHRRKPFRAIEILARSASRKMRFNGVWYVW